MIKNKMYHDDSINFYYQPFQDSRALEETIKFHQKSVFFIPNNNKKVNHSKEVKQFLEEVQFKIPYLKSSIEKIEMDSILPTNRGSLRNFEKLLNFKELSFLLSKSFGIDKKSSHRSFPSGGALFPIYPVLINLDNADKLEQGGYYYDGVDNTLNKFIEFSSDFEKKDLEYSLSYEDIPPSRMCIVYVGDLEKVFIKYQYAGYRHLSIETGMMAQSIKDALNEISGAGELSYSGYRHNSLCKLLNLSGTTMVVTLVQWIGKSSSFRG